MGFSITTRSGGKHAARIATRNDEPNAVVWLKRDGSANIWMQSEGQPLSEEEPREIEPTTTGSADLLALQSAELLRSQLLPLDPPSETSSEPSTQPGPYPRWSLGAGPAFLLSSYAGATAGLTFEAVYRLQQWLSIGPYIIAGLIRSPWNVEPPQFSVSQFSGGAQLRWDHTPHAPSAIRFGLVGRMGIRSLSLRGETGPPEERFTGSTTAITLGAGANVSYAVLSWLRVGGLLAGEAGFPVAWPEPTDALTPSQQSTLSEHTTTSRPDVQLITSVHLTAEF